MEATLLLSFQFLFFPGAQETLPIGTWASTPHIQVLIHTLCPQHRSIQLPVATVRPAGFYISSMAWPQEDGPLGKSLSIQTLEGMGGNLGRGVQCPWHGKHGPKRKMCELAGCVLMTPRTIAPQKGAQLEESLRRSLLCTDLRARAHLSGYDQYCLCLTFLILITSLSIPHEKQNKRYKMDPSLFQES